jgi:threonine/homoserine/homoserine lactone efflux protein
MQEVFALLAVVGALTVGVVSPGPSFVMIARTALARSRAEAVMAAVGMGVGGLIFAVIALTGLTAILTAVPSLYLALKLVGGAYLVWLGFNIWRGARTPLEMSTSIDASARTGFTLGLITQVSNPKTAVVYTTLFAALLPKTMNLSFALALLVCVFLVETLWYAAVALVLSSSRPRATYLRAKTGLDRLAGAVMMGLGLRLVASALPSR